jgi:hypothetical protein
MQQISMHAFPNTAESNASDATGSGQLVRLGRHASTTAAANPHTRQNEKRENKMLPA